MGISIPEIKSLLSNEILRVLEVRSIPAHIVIGAVIQANTCAQSANFSPNLTISGNIVRGNIHYQDWLAEFQLTSKGSTLPIHLRAQFQKALRGEVKTKKKKPQPRKRLVEAAVQVFVQPAPIPVQIVPTAAVPLQESIEPALVPIAESTTLPASPLLPVKKKRVSRKTTVGGKTQYTPVLLGAQNIPLLALLRGFVQSVGDDIGGELKAVSICTVLADRLGNVKSNTLTPILKSLLNQGIFGKEGKVYFLTPFGQVLYLTLNREERDVNEIDWGKVISHPRVDLDNPSNREAVWSVMANELKLQLATIHQAAEDEVAELQRKLAAANRRVGMGIETLHQLQQSRKLKAGLEGLRKGVKKCFGV